jgi:hypothetical protein
MSVETLAVAAKQQQLLSTMAVEMILLQLALFCDQLSR